MKCLSAANTLSSHCSVKFCNASVHVQILGREMLSLRIQAGIECASVGVRSLFISQSLLSSSSLLESSIQASIDFFGIHGRTILQGNTIALLANISSRQGWVGAILDGVIVHVSPHHLASWVLTRTIRINTVYHLNEV